jgi:hypothetical protein
MQTSEADQFYAVVRFIKAVASLLRALTAGKWADFARDTTVRPPPAIGTT